MKPVINKSISSFAIVFFLLLTLGGCIRSGIQVMPVPNQNTLVLDAREIVEILRVVGLNPDQIEENGWSVRDALARSGACRIMIDGTVEAAFAIRGDDIYISTRSTHHIYNVNTGWVNTSGK